MSERPNEPELTPDEMEDLLVRYARDHSGAGVDPNRLRPVLERALEHVDEHHPLRGEIRELCRTGATLFIGPDAAGDQLELRLGFPDDPAHWPKAHGRSMPLCQLPLAEILSRPQG
jgi:hypothetical protein